MQEGVITRIEKQYLYPVTLALQLVKYLCIFFEKTLLPQIHDHGDFCDVLPGIGLNLEESGKKNDRQVIDAEEPNILQRPEGGTLA